MELALFLALVALALSVVAAGLATWTILRVEQLDKTLEFTAQKLNQLDADLRG